MLYEFIFDVDRTKGTCAIVVNKLEDNKWNRTVYDFVRNGISFDHRLTYIVKSILDPGLQIRKYYLYYETKVDDTTERLKECYEAFRDGASEQTKKFYTQAQAYEDGIDFCAKVKEQASFMLDKLWPAHKDAI